MLVQSIFADYRDFCETYSMIYCVHDFVEEHLTALEKNLVGCEEQKLYVKIDVVFCAQEISYLSDYVGCDKP